MDMIRLSNEVLALKSEASVRKYYKEFLERVKKDGGARKEAPSMMMENVRKYGAESAVRASELPSPAPREHFLSLFGASDREVVDAASKDPNVGQMLSLMNGFVQRQLVNRQDAHVYQSLHKVTSTHEKIRRLYLAILSRPPSAQEMEWMMAEVESAGDQAYRNMVAALVMSSEFVFLQ
jgi:hypothetical protein